MSSRKLGGASHLERLPSIPDEADVWCDHPDFNSPQKVSVSTLRAAVSIAPETSEVYGGRLIYGGVVWISGLVFDVTASSYIIDGVTYFSDLTRLTLTAADATHPRIDVIYVDNAGLANYITGVPAADPAKPEVDTLTQLELTFVTVAALATTPTNTTADTLYSEDAGSPGEWDATESTSAARIDLDNAEFPYAGTACIKLDLPLNGDTFTLIDGVSLEGVSTGDMDGLEIHIRNTAWYKKKWLRIGAFIGNTRISSWVQVGNGPSFGFSTNIFNEYQTIVIPAAAFNFTGASFNRLVFEVGGAGPEIDAYIDNIRIQGGGGTVINNTYLGLTEEQLISTVRTFKAQQAFGNQALTDAATIEWDLNQFPVAEITLGGDRTITPINMLPGGTYILKVIQDATGTRIPTISSVNWAADTAPTFTTDGTYWDVLTFVCFDGTTLDGVVGGQAFVP